MTTLFEGGIPTEIDVRKLMDAFGNSELDAVIKHSDIERVTGISYGTPRYQTIVSSFKKRLLRECNLEVASERGVGYRVLNGKGRVSKGYERGNKAIKSIRQTHVRFTIIPRDILEPTEVTRVEHAQAVFAKLSEVVTRAKREIAPPRKAELLPRKV